jgi:hypothetical protein
MSDLQILHSVLEQTARRRRWQQAWRGLWQGLLVGSGLWLAALAIYKLAPVPLVVLAVAGTLAGVFVLTGFIAGWFHKGTLIETARWVDSRSQLQERLSTAVEVGAKEAPTQWQKLVMTDAVRAAQSVDPRKLLPFHLPRASRWAFLVLLLAAGLGFVPEYRSTDFVQKQKDKAIIKETGKQLVELTKRSLERRPPALDTTRKSLDAVAELGDHLAKAQLTRGEALKDLASVTEQLKEQARELGKNPAFKALERASRGPIKGGSQSTAELQKKIDELQKALGNEAADSEAVEKLKQGVQQAREAAQGLPDKDGAAADAARDGLAQNLADLMKQAKDMGLSLPNLEEAIAALAATQTDELLKDLEITENDLEKLLETAKAIEKLQAQAEKTGKDLPEQLEFGQADAAKSSLEKMIEKLSQNSPDQEELAKMLDEVSRAVNPASPYGKAAEFLKKASEDLKSGEKGDAAEALAQAAQELNKVMEQMSDAEAMMASLEALSRAQMSIGNGQSWSQTASSTPRAGKGGGVGAGVGTWADDSRWMDLNDIKDRWDNSGVVRPDTDARGVTDRGEGQLPDNLAATKIKGQLNPEGQMPSITLKGVSIKGVSKVDFQEMATAAQSDAQSALSQEQVPRAYQGAVRDYFDDLKK